MLTKISVTLQETWSIWKKVLRINEIFKEFETLAKKLGLNPSIPRIVSGQQNRNNALPSTSEEYFWAAIGFILLDNITEMESLFNPFNQMASELLFHKPRFLKTQKCMKVIKIPGNSRFLLRWYTWYSSFKTRAAPLETQMGNEKRKW